MRFRRVQEKVEDMETLINTHRAGFAQGSAGCHVQEACEHAHRRGVPGHLVGPAVPRPGTVGHVHCPPAISPVRTPRQQRQRGPAGSHRPRGSRRAWAPAPVLGVHMRPMGQTWTPGPCRGRLHSGEEGPGPPRAHSPSHCGQACPSCPVCQHHGGPEPGFPPGRGQRFWGAGQGAA